MRFSFVVATRLTENKFWKQAATGQALQKYRDLPNVHLDIHYNNTRGLGEVYAQALQKTEADYIIFLHDDVWFVDDDVLPEIHRALSVADIIGVAGTTKRHDRQPGWAFASLKTSNGFIPDSKYHSGKVVHGSMQDPNSQETSSFGPIGLRCKLMDGVLLGAHVARTRRAGVNFSPEFQFHFYDMDFCRSAEQRGLVMQTAAVLIIHESSGRFGTSAWWESYQTYLRKWGI